MREIPLTQGQVTIVDDEDFEWINKYKWFAHRKPLMSHRVNYYALRSIRLQKGKKANVSMARMILNAPTGYYADHKNHNTLDNRRCNLRLCTHMQNNQNKSLHKGSSSKYKGVHWHTKNKCWRARCCRKELGLFKNEKEAAKAYDQFANKQFGEFALLNKDVFPNDFT